MGEFEDLVDRAAAGDAKAAEALKESFGGSSLRKKAESGVDAQKRYDESLPDIRAGRFHSTLGKVAEEHRGLLSVDDIKDKAPEEITPELLESLAKTKAESGKAVLLQQAKGLGFETVEEMQEALGKVKQEQDTKRKNMESVGGATASGSGNSAPPEPEFDKAKKAYDDARGKGVAQDYALGRFVEVLIGEEGSE